MSAGSNETLKHRCLNVGPASETLDQFRLNLDNIQPLVFGRNNETLTNVGPTLAHCWPGWELIIFPLIKATSRFNDSLISISQNKE